jgi:outer membrane protein assembly factor BamA
LSTFLFSIAWYLYYEPTGGKIIFSLHKYFFPRCIRSFFSSCTIVKDYPVGKPFVYKTNIELAGKYNADEKKEIIQRLQEQLHDSIRVRSVGKIIGWDEGPKMFYSLIKSPAVFDTLNVGSSKIFMYALLNSLGHYRGYIGSDTTLEIRNDEQRTTVNFKVEPGTLFKLDSIAYTIGNDSLQSIAAAAKDTLKAVTGEARQGTILQKGSPFSKPLLSAERDRLANAFRNNGYLRFANDDIRVLWDTVGIAALRFTIDPFEQAQQLEALQGRRQNPVADVEYRLKPNVDSTHLIRYYVGNVTFYPDLTADTARFSPHITRIRNNTIITYHNLFKTRVILENTALFGGELYRQRNYIKTLNRFNALGTFRLVNIDAAPREGTDTVDFVVKLTPADKYVFEGNLEGSARWGNTATIFTTGNLIGVNLGLQNRNFSRGANLASTNARFGVGLSSTKRGFQTLQYSLSHVITFPRSVPRYRFLSPEARESARTSLAFNVNAIDIADLLYLSTINASWGYSFSWKKYLLSLRLPNIEFAFLERRPELEKLIEINESYKYIFNDGFISSSIAGLTINGGHKRVTNVTHFNLEASGLFTGLIHSKFTDSNLKRFIRLDGDFRQNRKLGRTSVFAWRAFAGAGYSMPLFKTDTSNFALPFFKAYSAGGSNSMRAWRLRRLGPGSTVRSFDPENYRSGLAIYNWN